MGGIYLLLGGNIGNRAMYLSMATEKISLLIGKIKASSSIWETEPWGFKHDTPFLNQLLVTDTRLEPAGVLVALRAIEKKLGRIRRGGEVAARTIDIDILFYNDRIISHKNLVIPHPELHKRRFALEPLVEVNPGLVHPVFNKTVSELLAECNDSCQVRKLQPGEPEII